MNKSDVVQLLLERFAGSLPEFKARKQQGDFVRRVPGGAQYIIFPLADYRPRFTFSVLVTVRLEEVEELYHSVRQTPERYRSMSATTTTRLNYFLPGEGREYEVTTPEEIAAIALRLSPGILDRVVPFLDAHKDAKGLDAVVNATDKGKFDFTLPPHGDMAALILARLAANPRYDELVLEFERRAESWEEADRASLRTLVERLRTEGR